MSLCKTRPLVKTVLFLCLSNQPGYVKGRGRRRYRALQLSSGFQNKEINLTTVLQEPKDYLLLRRPASPCTFLLNKALHQSQNYPLRPESVVQLRSRRGFRMKTLTPYQAHDKLN